MLRKNRRVRVGPGAGTNSIMNCYTCVAQVACTMARHGQCSSASKNSDNQRQKNATTFLDVALAYLTRSNFAAAIVLLVHRHPFSSSHSTNDFRQTSDPCVQNQALSIVDGFDWGGTPPEYCLQLIS